MWFQAPYDMYIDAVRPVAALLEFGGWWVVGRCVAAVCLVAFLVIAWLLEYQKLEGNFVGGGGGFAFACFCSHTLCWVSSRHCPQRTPPTITCSHCLRLPRLHLLQRDDAPLLR